MIVKRIVCVVKQALVYLVKYAIWSCILILGIWFLVLISGVAENNEWEFAIRIVNNSYEYEFNPENFRENLIWCIGRFATNVFNFFFVARLCMKVFEPTKAFYFSKYAVYDANRKKIVFRYWIPRRRRTFLFGARVMVSLITEDEYRRGVNNIKPLWKWDGNSKILGMVRGVRYIELPKRETKKLINCIRQYVNSKTLIVAVTINATDNSGRSLYEIHTYKLSDIIAGYQFAPVKNDPYCADLLKKEVNQFSDLGRVLAKGICFSNYHNFHCVYEQKSAPKKKVAKIFSSMPEKKHIVSKDEAVFGKKGWRRIYHCPLDFWTWSWYDWDVNPLEWLVRIGRSAKFNIERWRYY